MTEHITSVGLALLQTLKNYGTEVVFGIPGTHNLELYRHLDALGIRAITARHEQGAGYAADAYSQRAGRPGVVFATSGPGLLNTLSAAANAYCESRALLIIAPGPPLSAGADGAACAGGDVGADGAAGAEVGAACETGTLHETKDQLGAAAAVVARAVRAESAAEAVAAVHEAFEMFHVKHRRPFYLEVPLDVLEAECSVPVAVTEARPAAAPRGAPQAEIDAAAQLLLSARRPLILAGGGATAATRELRELAELLNAPVVTTMNGKGALPETHPLAIGSQLRLEPVAQAANAADVLLVVGSKLGVTEFWEHEFAPRGSVIRIDRLANKRTQNITADVFLEGDAAAILGQLRAKLQRLLSAAPGAASAQQRESWLDVAELREEIFARARRIAPREDALAARLVHALPPGTILTADSSQICYLGTANRFVADGPHEYLYMATFATLGYGLPAAIGARVADPARPVVAILGDGALMFALQELLTAVAEGLNITVVCVDNGGYGEIRDNELQRGITPIGVDLTQPDWPLLAAAVGGAGFAVLETEQLESQLAAAMEHPGLALVHIRLADFDA